MSYNLFVSGADSPKRPIWWSSGWQSLWRGTMFPCHVTPWPSAEPPASCGSHVPPAQPSQPLPDLLCSCPAPPLNTHAETPSPDPMESLIVVTEYEPCRPPGETGEEEVRRNTPMEHNRHQRWNLIRRFLSFSTELDFTLGIVSFPPHVRLIKSTLCWNGFEIIQEVNVLSLTWYVWHKTQEREPNCAVMTPMWWWTPPTYLVPLT